MSNPLLADVWTAKPIANHTDKHKCFDYNLREFLYMARLKHKKITAFGIYWDQILSYKRISIPALVLPGIGLIFTSYIPPLLIAMMIRAFGGKIPTDIHAVLPY